MPRNINYRADHLEDLRNDPEFAAEYLSAAYADSREAFLVALRDIAEARKGIARVAHEAEVNRENLYRMLSKEGNPRFSSLKPILESLDIGVQFSSLGPRPANPEPVAACAREAEPSSQNTSPNITCTAFGWIGGYANLTSIRSSDSPRSLNPRAVPLYLFAKEETSEHVAKYGTS